MRDSYEMIVGLGRDAAMRQKCMRESLIDNVAVSVAERMPARRRLCLNSCCGEGLEVIARAQESGAVKVLPMQVMCKQWNRGDGTEHVRIILIPALIACVRVDPPWLPLTGGLADNLETDSHRHHGTHDCFGTGDSAYLHVWVRRTAPSVMVMMTKRLETSLGPGRA